MTSCTFRQRSCGRSRNAWNGQTPALLKRTSIRPNSCTACSTICAADQRAPRGKRDSRTYLFGSSRVCNIPVYRDRLPAHRLDLRSQGVRVLDGLRAQMVDDHVCTMRSRCQTYRTAYPLTRSGTNDDLVLSWRSCQKTVASLAERIYALTKDRSQLCYTRRPHALCRPYASMHECLSDETGNQPDSVKRNLFALKSQLQAGQQQTGCPASRKHLGYHVQPSRILNILWRTSLWSLQRLKSPLESSSTLLLGECIAQAGLWQIRWRMKSRIRLTDRLM